MKYDINNKTFLLLQNSDSGEVDESTSFYYNQKGNLVTAEYSSGSIEYGKIIAILKEDHLDMLYQCVTKDSKLKAGQAIANISVNQRNKIVLKLNCQWLNESKESGTSVYIEQENLVFSYQMVFPKAYVNFPF